MNLIENRDKINEIDEKLIKLFEDRMEVAADIARYKKENGLPILDSKREREKLCAVRDLASDEMKNYTEILFNMLMEMSKSYQVRKTAENCELLNKVNKAIEDTNPLFPRQAIVACQGVEGAYSMIAAEKLFAVPNIMYFEGFENVFQSVANGLCEYGVLPIENSTAGSVWQTYDLMLKYDFNIVKSIRIKVDHNLLVKRGVKLSDIKEVISHPQAISQCRAFFNAHPEIKATPVENTAMAAEMVAISDRSDLACLASSSAASRYQLEVLERSVQDRANNYTRFICFTKNTAIYPGANRTSLMMVLPHRPGALNTMLSRFYALGLNLLKIESRPIPEKDFEFMFYFDVEGSIYSDEFKTLLAELSIQCDEFKYLGTYQEVIL